MTYSQNAVQLIKHFEGCRFGAYQDAVGVWTIGYGCTEGVKQGMVITLQQAEALLKSAMDQRAHGVASLLKVSVAQNQFDALLSFAYNLGVPALCNSSLLRLLNQGNVSAATQEFPKWVHAHGRILPGLVKRRAAEQQLFATGVLALL